MATTENEELQQLRLKVVQLESQLKETLTELRTLKLRNEELEAKLADQTVTNTTLRESLSRKGAERDDEETTIELQYDPGPGPFIDFAAPDNETNIAFIEEIKDLATSTKTRRTTSFLFNSSSNSPSRKNSSSGLASSTQPGLGSLFDDQRPNVQVKILDSKNGESMSDLFVACRTFNIRETSTQSSEAFKTKVLKKPGEGWNESHSIYISDIISYRLSFQIYEWKALGSNQKLLETSIALGTLLENQTQDIWLTFPGTIFQLHIELSYFQFVKTKIKGATIAKIVEKMTPPNRKDRDRELVYEFLLTYQLYTTPHHLLDMLIQRFNGLDVNHPDYNRYKHVFPAIRNSVGFVLFKWIRITKDFHRDNSLCLKLSEFIAKAGKSAYLDFVFSDLQKILDTPPEIVDLPSSTEKLNIDEIDAETIAEQITYIEYNLVRKIDPFEFLNQHWMKENKAKLAGNIINYISWFNKISSWISTEIIKRNSAEERSVVIGKFIQMAKKFRSLNNFNGIMEVLASLHGSAISRLQSSWLLLPKNLSDNFLELSELMQPNENFKKYRETNKNLTPSIPHIALILQDLTFIYDGNPDTVENGLLNLEKTKMVYRKIKEFQHFLSKEYAIKALPHFKETFDTVEVWQEHDIYRLSKVKEKKSDNIQHTSRFDSKTFEKISRNIMSGSQNVSTEVIDLTERDWQLLLTLSTVRTFEKENYIIKEGGVNTYFYKIKEGVVRVEKNINNENQVLRKLEVNATFGEMSLVGLVTASIISDTNVELWAIDIELTHALFESEAGLSLRFFCKLAQGLASILVSLSSNKKPAPASPAIEAPPVSPTPVKKEAPPQTEDTESLDIILRRHFDLAKDQVVVKHYKCALKKKLNLWGQIFITKNFICFLAKTLGLYSTLKINIENVTIVYIQGEKELIIQQNNQAKHGFLFKDKHELWESHHFITTIWTNRTQQMKKRGSFTTANKEISTSLIPNSPSTTTITTTTTSSATSTSAIYEQETQSIFETMRPEDWDLLLQGAKSVTIMKGQDIIKQGEIYQRIYQINRGQCRIEILKNNQRVKLGVMNVRETFGEISFLIGGNGASAFVVAEEEVELTVIEGYYINALFNVNPQFAGRFYKYLAFLLAHRIKQRQKQ